mgnify:CR=1 FL=1
MFRLREELQRLKQDIRKAIHGDNGRYKFQLMAGYCSPKRNVLTGLFKQYGIKDFKVTETLEKDKNDYPLYFYLTADVNTTQANWAEYLILRSKKFTIVGDLYNEKNRQWADKSGMPTAWKDKKPLIEKSCSEGIKLWKRRKRNERT